MAMIMLTNGAGCGISDGGADMCVVRAPKAFLVSTAAIRIVRPASIDHDA